MNYLRQHGTRETPQNEPMRADQVANNAGALDVVGLDASTPALISAFAAGRI
jgi:hypothetical protein